MPHLLRLPHALAESVIKPHCLCMLPCIGISFLSNLPSAPKLQREFVALHVLKPEQVTSCPKKPSAQSTSAIHQLPFCVAFWNQNNKDHSWAFSSLHSAGLSKRFVLGSENILFCWMEWKDALLSNERQIRKSEEQYFPRGDDYQGLKLGSQCPSNRGTRIVRTFDTWKAASSIALLDILGLPCPDLETLA